MILAMGSAQCVYANKEKYFQNVFDWTQILCDLCFNYLSCLTNLRIIFVTHGQNCPLQPTCLGFVFKKRNISFFHRRTKKGCNFWAISSNKFPLEDKTRTCHHLGEKRTQPSFPKNPGMFHCRTWADLSPRNHVLGPNPMRKHGCLGNSTHLS